MRVERVLSASSWCGFRRTPDHTSVKSWPSWSNGEAMIFSGGSSSFSPERCVSVPGSTSDSGPRTIRVSSLVGMRSRTGRWSMYRPIRQKQFNRLATRWCWIAVQAFGTLRRFRPDPRHLRRGTNSVCATQTTSPNVSASAGQGSVATAGLSLANSHPPCAPSHPPGAARSFARTPEARSFQLSRMRSFRLT